MEGYLKTELQGKLWNGQGTFSHDEAYLVQYMSDILVRFISHW